jgi:hypothetical protein
MSVVAGSRSQGGLEASGCLQGHRERGYIQISRRRFESVKTTLVMRKGTEFGRERRVSHKQTAV